MLALAFVLMLPSNVFALGIPLFGAVANQEQGADVGLVVDEDYVEVYDWLEEVGTKGEVVLAAPRISLWVPAVTDLRVVYGHPMETIQADKRQDQVEDFFGGLDCDTLLDNPSLDFEVSYVIWGPEERELTSEVQSDIHEDEPEREFENCIAVIENDLIANPEQIKQFGDVTLFTLRPLR
jgi:hypothetical protein